MKKMSECSWEGTVDVCEGIRRVLDEFICSFEKESSTGFLRLGPLWLGQQPLGFRYQYNS